MFSPVKRFYRVTGDSCLELCLFVMRSAISSKTLLKVLFCVKQLIPMCKLSIHDYIPLI